MSAPGFSANLGFLFTDRPLPEAVRAAADAGFAAVECHWPYATPAAELKRALDAAGLPLLGINTARGGAGEFGLSALPGREDEARAAIGTALDYAADAGARHLHVMAGMARGAEAEAAFLDNLAHAARRAEVLGIGILIEPLNARDAPGYFLQTTDQAAAILDRLGRPGVRMMFDCYHVEMQEGDILARFRRHRDRIGHVQFAQAPGRGAPVGGGIDFGALFPALRAAGYDGYFGAEYRPAGRTEDSLGWLADLQR